MNLTFRPNIGETDRKIRFAIGAILIVYGLARPLPGFWPAGYVLSGIVLSLEAYFRY